MLKVSHNELRQSQRKECSQRDRCRPEHRQRGSGRGVVAVRLYTHLRLNEKLDQSIDILLAVLMEYDLIKNSLFVSENYE